MNFSLAPTELAFRDELRAWIQKHIPGDFGTPRWPAPEGHGAKLAAGVAWAKKLNEGRWAAVHWPAAYGGRDASPMEQFILYDEMAGYRTPIPPTVIGLGMAGPVLMHYGTDAQRERYLRKIVSADEIWCQGFSEPNAGSDVANLSTSAVASGDHYLVNGQKIWTSFGSDADWCLLLARTDPTVPKHKGISCLLVDMRTPGVEVRPIRQITGESEFTEVFFTNVVVPRANLLGREHDGWRVAITTLMHERANIAALVYAGFKRELREVVGLAKRLTRHGRPLTEDPVVRRKLVDYYAVAETLRINNIRMRVGKSAADDPGPIGSIFKLVWATANQSMHRLAVDVLGPAAELLAGPGAESGGHGDWLKRYLRTLANSIEGGTSEILRGIVAERILGLGRTLGKAS
ncbi:MAG: acyl-CoA dehydrogenase [Gemmatimonadetes bacterium]|nr:acyl-CoA dehydrogenase [Gemmatimonadota bacterium]